MDSRTSDRATTPDAAEFVRFCYRRRRVGWPELYDEMCAVASRGLYRGWGHEELADAGVRFTLFDLPALASLVSQVIAEEQERRTLFRAEAPRPTAVHVAAATHEPTLPGRRHDAEDVTSEPVSPLSFAVASAGA